MSKFATFGDYPKESLPSAEAALLTAWRSLDRATNSPWKHCGGTFLKPIRTAQFVPQNFIPAMPRTADACAKA